MWLLLKMSQHRRMCERKINMETFWTLLAKSVILSGFIVVVCMGTLCFLAITGKPIPEVLVNITLTVVGFYFGSKVGNTEATNNIARALRK